jgi:hypothetical protein
MAAPHPTRSRSRRRTGLVVAALSVLAVGAAPAMAVEGIGDRVFHDFNNNGIFDTTEVGVPGVTVNLELDYGSGPIDPITGRREGPPDCIADDLPGYPTQTRVTNANGAYFFNAVGQGNYILEIPTSNFLPGQPLAGFSSSTGSPLTTGPFEPGIPESNDVADDNKDHGTVASNRIRVCNVRIVVNSEPVGEAPTPGITVDLPDNSQNTTIDFGVFKPAGGGIDPNAPPPGTVPPTGGSGTPGGGGAKPAWTIGDRVWSDIDKDGIQDAIEPGIPNVEVKLYDALGTDLGTTTTDIRGRYTFEGLVAGRFRVGFAKLPLRAQATANGKGARRANDSDVVPRIGRTALIRLRGGDLRTDIDAGYVVPTAIGGTVWRDLDVDGQQDPEEKTRRRVAVSLQDLRGRVVAQTVTNGKGKYTFFNVTPGKYRVAVTPPPGFRFTLRDKGSDLTDSDIVPAQRRTKKVGVGAGRQVLTVGAGIRK